MKFEVDRAREGNKKGTFRPSKKEHSASVRVMEMNGDSLMVHTDLHPGTLLAFLDECWVDPDCTIFPPLLLA